MQAFRAVVERGGFAAGGASLGRSKSSVSKLVSALEAHVGAQLLLRTTRRIALTEVGLRYFDEAVSVLDAIEAMDDRAGEQVAQPRGLLRVNAPMSWGITRLAPVAARFMAAHPDIRLDLRFDDRRRHPLEDGVDVSLRIAVSLDDSELAARRIGAIHHVVCAASAYLDGRSMPIHPDELADHRLLAYLPHAAQAHYVFRAEHPGDDNAITVTTTPALVANSSLAIRAALLDGAGIAVIPRFAVAGDLADGGLVELLSTWRSPDHALHAIFAPGPRLPAKTRAFVDFLVAQRGALADD